MYRLLGNRDKHVIASRQPKAGPPLAERRSNLITFRDCFVALLLAMTLQPSQVYAFVEFQTFIEQKSKKQLNCAYCHSHTNGPEGDESGQLRSLDEKQKQSTAYNQFLQSNKEFIDSPILNEFGNYLVKKLGYETITSAQNEPNKLVEGLKDSDLDNDGIKDSQELLEGTLPNDPFDGNSLRLFLNGVKKKWIEISFQAIVILFLIISLLKLRT